MAIIALQQFQHAADALQAYAAAAQIAEYGEFDKIFGGVKAAMSLAGGRHNALLIPPLQLAWCEAGALANLAGCEACAHCLHRTKSLGTRLQRNRNTHLV